MGNRKITIADRILSFLDGETEPQKAKIIATGIKENYGSVRNTLRRLLKDGKILNDGTGYLSPSVYISEIGAIYKELRVHGIKLQHRDSGESYKLKTSPYLMLHANYSIHKHKINHAITLTENWNGYKVTITIHRKELIEIWLNCSENGLSIMEFYGFSQWIQGIFPKILSSQWEMVQYGLNVDYPRLQLDGVESITLAMFESTLLRLYNKNKDRLRVELHGTIPISFDQAILLLSKMTTETKNMVVKDKWGGK